MTTAYTSLLGLALPVTGELSGTWGDTVNTSITALLDTSVAGTTNVSTDADVTLTTTTGAANTARQAILLFSGARTVLRTVTAPAQSKVYTVINATTGGFAVKLVGAGPTTGLTIPNGASAIVAWNGSDFIEIGTSSIGNLVVNGTLTVTGATTLSAALTYGGVTLSNAVTGTGNMVLSAAPTFTGTASFSAITASSTITGNGNWVIGNADTDTITENASYVTGTQLKSAKVATNTLNLAAYDVDGAAYTNLITLTASNTPTLALTSTGVGTINNMSIGATTASTGAFTTLTTSSTVTLNGGTANGVAYLNGSKVVTSGSALTFDGTNFANTGNITAGTTGSGANLVAYASTYTTNGLVRLFGTDGNNKVEFGAASATTAFLTARTGVSMIFGANDTEQMRLTSTGLGIGTTSPENKLTIIKDTTAATENSYGIAIQSVNTNAYTELLLGASDAVDAGIIQTASKNTNFTAKNLALQPQGGNVGIGTTSPTFAAGTGLQVKGAGFTSVRVTQGALTGTDLSQDASGGYLYVRDNLPLMFGTNNTERARIDSSGNLLVGNTTAYGIINGYTAQGGTQLSILHGTAGSYPKVSGIAFGQPTTSITVSNNGGTTAFSGGAGIYANNTAASGNPTELVFWVNASGSPSEAARIDSSGNVGINTSSPACKLDVNGRGRFVQDAAATTGAIALRQNSGDTEGAFIQWTTNNAASEKGWLQVDTSSNMKFATVSSERMRIDSSGNLLVGTTSQIDNERFSSVTTGTAAYFKTSGTSQTVTQFWNTATSGTIYQAIFRDGASATSRGSISTDGSATAYNTSSDYRLKENIVDLPNALATVAQLKPCQFDWKETGNTTTGFIAHELAEVCPQAVTGEKDAVDENGNPKYQGIDTSFLVATLTAAIQEQQEIINSLKARLDAANL